jgi:PKD repeat protein
MKRLLIILPLASLLVTGCYKEPVPFADAIISPNPAWVGEDITFDNYSYNMNYVEWSMGDGTTSSAFNVVHYYDHPGFYDVNLRAYGTNGQVSIASFVVEVEGSELRVIVEEIVQGYLIKGASVVLFASLDDWYEADYSKAVAEEFTNDYGECYFSGLSYQRYYVDVYEESHVNWLLGEEDPYRWIETQKLPGGWDHTFIAYVDYVTWEKKSAGRPAERPSLENLKNQLKGAGAERPRKENKVSVKKERE